MSIECQKQPLNDGAHPYTTFGMASIESTYRPSVDFTDATDFLFHTYRNLPDQDAFTVRGTPDKVIGQFIRDVFGVLCIHTHQYNICSHACEVPIGAALPLIEREGDAAALSSKLISKYIVPSLFFIKMTD